MVILNIICAFLNAYATEYDLSMEDVFLYGGSAGADLAEIYGMALVDPEYAQAMGFKAALTKEQVKGLILD